MAISIEEAEKINLLYQQLDAMTLKYNKALEDIHKLTHKITDYADALAIATKCECKCQDTKKSKAK